MTGPENIQDWAAIFGVLVAAVGFLAVIIQLKQVERGLRSGARGSIYDMGSRMKEVFIQHPHLRPYFFNGEPIAADHEDYALALAVADYYCLYLEQITTQGENISAKSRGTWYRYAAAIYASSPIIQAYLADKQEWYAPVFWNIVEGHQQGFDQAGNPQTS